MSHAVKLIADCPVDHRVGVSVNICPDRRVAIKVLPAEAVAKNGPGPFDKDERIARAPVPHLSEWVPGMGLVPGRQRIGMPNVSHRPQNYISLAGT